MKWICAFFGKQRSHPMRSQHISVLVHFRAVQSYLASPYDKNTSMPIVYFCLEEDLQISDLKIHWNQFLHACFYIFFILLNAGKCFVVVNKKHHKILCESRNEKDKTETPLSLFVSFSFFASFFVVVQNEIRHIQVIYKSDHSI